MRTRSDASGFVKLYRALLDSPLWKLPPHYLRLWNYLLLRVRWKDEPMEVRGVRIERGQFLRSLRKIAEDCSYWENQRERKWSTSTTRRMLRRLEDEGMIATRETDLGTLITVLNFVQYQGSSEALPSPTKQTRGTPAKQEEEGKRREDSGANHDEDVRIVFEYWSAERLRVLGPRPGPRMTLSGRRAGRVRARLAEGYTVDQLKEAVLGCLGSASNVRGGYIDLELICRDQAKVEQYRSWYMDGLGRSDSLAEVSDEVLWVEEDV